MPAAHNLGGDTREKLPICERLVALADDLNLPLGNERRLELREDADTIDALYEALDLFVREYVELVESGDAGFWDAEGEEKVKKARAALSRARNGGQP
jgi:hypothetical protein